MEVTLCIPDELAAQIIFEGKSPSRMPLETLALEGLPVLQKYSSRTL